MLWSPFILAGDGKSCPDISEIGVPDLKTIIGAFSLSSKFRSSKFVKLAIIAK